MREIELNYIEINGVKYPIYCDLNVLELIQDAYTSVNQFERDILGLAPIKDKDGNLLHNDDGSLKCEQVEPKIKAIVFGLFLMIREGQRIEERQTGKKVELIDNDDLREGCRESFIELSMAVREAFNRCFEVKKKSKTTNRKKNRSTT